MAALQPAVRLLPFQRQLADELSTGQTRQRIVLQAPPGSGKAVALAAACGRLTKRQAEQPRILIVAPAMLLVQWAEQLHSVATIEADVIDGPRYRQLKARARDGNPWTAVQAGVVSIDFLKTAERAQEISSVPWDLLIIDAADSLSGSTLRVQAARLLWGAAQVRRAVASATLAPPAWLQEFPGSSTITWKPDQLLVSGLDRGSGFVTVAVNLSEAERHLYEAATRTFEEFDWRKKGGTFSFGPIAERIAGSSLYAAESLFSQTLESLEGALAADANDHNVVQLSTASLAAAAARLRELVERTAEVEVDSKWETCAPLLRELTKGRRASAVVFTDFADTAAYLSLLCEDRGWPSWEISGRLPQDERRANLKGARNDPGITIVTSELVELLDPRQASGFVHYDLPIEASDMFRRIGVVTRSSTKQRPQYLLLDGLMTSAVHVHSLGLKMRAFQSEPAPEGS